MQPSKMFNTLTIEAITVLLGESLSYKFQNNFLKNTQISAFQIDLSKLLHLITAEGKEGSVSRQSCVVRGDMKRK